MNYAEARELSDKSGWHFTVRNDDRIWTHECCRDNGAPATEEDVKKYGYRLGEPTLGKAHAPHATRAEAEECFNAWRFAQPIEFTDSLHSDWTGCQALLEHDPERAAAIAACVTPAYHETHRYCPSCPWTEADEKPTRCDAPTKGGARVHDIGGPDYFALCEEHRTDEVVRQLQGRVTASAYS